MEIEGSKVLVTGAGGFIGSHLVEALVKNGADVRAFVRYTSTGTTGFLGDLSGEILANVEIVRGDLRDPIAMHRAVKGCNCVFHLGALIAIPYSYVHPMEYVQVNVAGTANLLCACLEEEVDRFIHTSTSEVYGTARFVPITEEHPLQGQSPYSASKIGADKLVESFVRSFSLPAVTVRPFNTYGPRQSTRAVIPTIINQALQGDNIRLGALTPTRDFNFVTDTVAGMLCAMRVQGHNGEVFNLGTGNEVSIGRLAEIIGKLLDKELLIEQKDERLRPAKSEVNRLCADASKAWDLLGWKPAVQLTEGLGRCIEYYRTHGPDTVDRYHI